MSKPRKYDDTYRLLITAGVKHEEADQIAREAAETPVYVQVYGRGVRKFAASDKPRWTCPGQEVSRGDRKPVEDKCLVLDL